MLENMYKEVFENGYDNLYKILTNESKESITPTECYSVISFVVSIFYRNNYWINLHNKFMDQVYESIYFLSKANGNDVFYMEEQEISIVGKTLGELQSECKSGTKQRIALLTAKRIFELTRWRLINDVITIVEAGSDCEFITSDNPVTVSPKIAGEWPIPFDPTNTLSIPIDHKHLLQLRPWGKELDIRTLFRMHEHGNVGAINAAINNKCQLAQSERFILGTQTGLQKFQENTEGILQVKTWPKKLYLSDYEKDFNKLSCKS